MDEYLAETASRRGLIALYDSPRINPAIIYCNSKIWAEINKSNNLVRKLISPELLWPINPEAILASSFLLMLSAEFARTLLKNMFYIENIIVVYLQNKKLIRFYDKNDERIIGYHWYNNEETFRTFPEQHEIRERFAIRECESSDTKKMIITRAQILASSEPRPPRDFVI